MRNAGQHIYAALTKPHKLCKTSSQDSQDLARSSQDLAKHGFALSAYSRAPRDTPRNNVLHLNRSRETFGAKPFARASFLYMVGSFSFHLE